MCYLYKHTKEIFSNSKWNMQNGVNLFALCAVCQTSTRSPSPSLSLEMFVCTMVRVWFFGELPNRWTRWWLFLIFVALFQYHCHMMTMQFDDMCLSHWMLMVFVFHLDLSIQWAHVCSYEFIQWNFKNRMQKYAFSIRMPPPATPHRFDSSWLTAKRVCIFIHRSPPPSKWVCRCYEM